MTTPTKKAASPDRRKTASGQQRCACESKCNPCACAMQAEQAFNLIQAEDARWKTNNFCADCGGYVGDEFASCSSQKAHRRGPVWCDACTTRREASR